MGCIFLTTLILECCRANVSVWKDGSLGTLFHGLDGKLREADKDLITETNMESRAEETKVQLVMVDGRLVLG